ncbi:MAG: sigma-70 family RNA polymerase sigma factor [Planctomycetes bacterium]|nr:sigma-70 family RNA polymerase sigma factor [Planctomycetota bacterium]
MTVPDDDDDALASLLERVAARDPAAEEALCRRFWPFVRRRVEEARRRRNWFWLGDVEGVVQDVFTQFFHAQRAGRFAFEGRRRLEGFLVRTAFFVAMNQKDRAGRERALSLFDEEEGRLRFDVAALAEALPDQLDRAECLRLLARAIAGLNENRREVVERTLLGQKVREICAETGRSAASVSGLKFNAFVDLREALAAVGFLGRCGAMFGLAADGEDGPRG